VIVNQRFDDQIAWDFFAAHHKIPIHLDEFDHHLTSRLRMMVIQGITPKVAQTAGIFRLVN
jgi:hypothetical protein